MMCLCCVAWPPPLCHSSVCALPVDPVRPSAGYGLAVAGAQYAMAELVALLRQVSRSPCLGCAYSPSSTGPPEASQRELCS